MKTLLIIGFVFSGHVQALICKISVNTRSAEMTSSDGKSMSMNYSGYTCEGAMRADGVVIAKVTSSESESVATVQSKDVARAEIWESQAQVSCLCKG